MRQIFPIVLLACLAGCVTAPVGERLSDAAMQTLVRDTAARVDQFSYLFGVDGEPDFAGVLASLSELRVQAASRTVIGLDATSLRQMAELAALGVTVSVCEDNVSRLHLLYDSDRAAAMAQARDRFRLSCVVPLSVLAV